MHRGLDSPSRKRNRRRFPRSRTILVLYGIGSLMLSCSRQAGSNRPDPPFRPAPLSEPPPTRVVDVVEVLHGVAVPDPYRWLEEGTDEVKQWTEAQNARTRKYLDSLPFREAIRKRLDSLLLIGSIGTPTVRKGRLFYTRRTGSENQPVLYRRDGPRGAERELLNPNRLSEDGTISLDWYYPSEDGSLLAYGLSQGGTEQSTLHIRDVGTGKDLPDRIDRTRACSLAWLPDASGFYYTRYPKPGTVPAGEEAYHRHIYFHRLGADPEQDPKVFGEGRPKEDWTGVSLSPNGRWLLFTVWKGWSRTDVYLADTTSDKVTPVVEGKESRYLVDVLNDRLVITTDEGAPKYRVFTADPERPARENWREIIPEGPDAMQWAAVLGKKIVAEFLHDASSRLKVFSLEGKEEDEIELPTLGTVAGVGGEWDGPDMYFGFTSYTYPDTIYRYEFGTGIARMWDRVASDLRPEDFETKQVFVTSKDGTRIPMFLVHLKGYHENGKRPTLLTGYGGFQMSLTPGFQRNLYLFLERGGVYASACLRGGGEYGSEWHKAGKGPRKQNVFDDFLSCAEWLIANRVTDAAHLAIYGGSNGGLLVGAAVTQRPERFRAAVCEVPLLDMVRYPRFQIARLWIPEYGDPSKPDEFAWLYAYSPYHRVKDGTVYPSMLITSAEGDTRVDPMHARKFAARMQAASRGGPVLLRIDAKMGHGAGMSRAQQLERLTDQWCFLFSELGIE